MTNLQPFTKNLTPPAGLFAGVGESGQPEEPVIIVRTMIKTSDRRRVSELFTQILRANDKLKIASTAYTGLVEAGAADNELDQSGSILDQLAADIEQLGDEADSVYLSLIVSWNIADPYTLDRLPLPSERAGVKDDLAEPQTKWLFEELRNLHKYEVTEGNAPNTSA